MPSIPSPSPYVLPPLIGLWHLDPQHIGSLIGIGFLGQLVGAIAFGWIAEHWGRRSSMLATLLIFSLGALACAAAPATQCCSGCASFRASGSAAKFR